MAGRHSTWLPLQVSGLEVAETVYNPTPGNSGGVPQGPYQTLGMRAGLLLALRRRVKHVFDYC